MKKIEIRKRELKSPASAEALNAICSNLLFKAGDMRRIVISGCADQVGAGFMARQIACNLGRRGKKTLLVDADLRGGEQADGKTGGLLPYLQGKSEDAVFETDAENVFLIPAGGRAEDPIPLLAGPRFRALVEKAAQDYDPVLVLAPSLGETIDAAEIARGCDAAVLIMQYGVTTWKQAETAQRQMQSAGCPVLGCIINQADERAL